jgi:hypothetical protein
MPSASIKNHEFRKYFLVSNKIVTHDDELDKIFDDLNCPPQIFEITLLSATNFL